MERKIREISYCTWNYFVQLPIAEQVEYLTNLQEYFGASCQDIANYFGISKSFLYNHMKGIKAPHLNLKKTQSEAQAEDWELWVSHKESGLKAQKEAKKEVQKKHLEQKTAAEKLEAEVAKKRKGYLDVPKTLSQIKKLKIRAHQENYILKFLRDYGVDYKLLSICMECDYEALRHFAQDILKCFPKGRKNRPNAETVAKVCMFFANEDEVAAKAILDKYNSARGKAKPIECEFGSDFDLQAASILEEPAVVESMIAEDTEVEEHDVITRETETKDVLDSNDPELIIIKIGGCEFKIPADQRDIIPDLLAAATS